MITGMFKKLMNNIIIGGVNTNSTHTSVVTVQGGYTQYKGCKSRPCMVIAP